MTKRRGWFTAAVCVGLGLTIGSSALWARQGVLKTKDGRTLEGDIEERKDEITISIRGIQTKLDPTGVASVDYFDNVDARYKERLAKFPKAPTAKDHLDLSKWLMELHAYDLALREVDNARRVEPNSAEAAALEQTIMSQRRLDRVKANPPTGTGTPPVATGTGGTPKPPAAGGVTGKPVDHKYLTPEDINIIRQVEWKETDTVIPRVQVPANVRTRYVTMRAINAAEFAALTAPQQAYKILTDPDSPAEIRKEVKMLTDPANLVDFRRNIQPLVISNCATIGCHGGHNAGKFFLFNTNTEKDEVAYTNFYILRRYKQPLGDKTYQMIDPQFENLSVLGQFALHPDVAEIDHPEIKGHVYKPIAANKTSPSYVKLVSWMRNLVSGEPKYGVEYELPVSNPAKAVKPADKPATPAAPATPATPAPPAPATPATPGTPAPAKPAAGGAAPAAPAVPAPAAPGK